MTPGKRGRPGAPGVARAGQVEGRRAVAELLRAGHRRVHQVLVAEPAGTAGGPLAEIVGLARAAGVPVRAVQRAYLDSVALTDAPQGVLARADPVPEVDLGELARPLGGVPAFVVVLEGVTDPHNVGAVLRSALCAGATGAVIGRHRAAGLTPAAVKAAAGAVEHLPLATVAGIPAALATLASAGVWTVGLEAGAPSSMWGLEIASEPLAVVLGAEAQGLSRLARQRCELLVSIPMMGPLGSLNVATAAALACFEVARRRAGRAPS